MSWRCCDINFFNLWTFLRNCDTGAIQSKMSQEVIRSDVSSEKKSLISTFREKKRFAQELLEELQELSYQVLSNQKKALPAHVVGLRHDRTRSVRVSVGCAKHGDIWWRVESFFWWLKFLGEGGLWDESWFLALQSISNSSHSLSIPTRVTRPTLLYSFSSYSILTLRHLFPHDLPIRSIFHMTFSASSDFMTEKKANL